MNQGSTNSRTSLPPVKGFLPVEYGPLTSRTITVTSRTPLRIYLNYGTLQVNERLAGIFLEIETGDRCSSRKFDFKATVLASSS